MAMSPAGAGPSDVVTMVAAPIPCASGKSSLVRSSDFVVRVIAPGLLSADPPKILVLSEVSFNVTLVAAVPIPSTPCTVICPAEPASVAKLRLSLVTRF